jgi:DNA-binding Lrp family transcriptional regulator
MSEYVTHVRLSTIQREIRMIFLVKGLPCLLIILKAMVEKILSCLSFLLTQFVSLLWATPREILMIDAVDEQILSALSQNSKQDTAEIWDFLRDHGYSLTEEEIESKISRLQDSGVIRNYTISVDTKKLRRRVIRVALLRFKVSQHLASRLEGLKKYLADAPFVLFSGRTRGGIDWITCHAFLSEEMADEESDIFRNLFGDIIQSYEVYDFAPTKEASLHALTHSNDEYKQFLDEWIPPFLGRR